ncbi:MAG: hypothetical protein DBX59_11410 [Bacillota bacterium]|nr:MAG: hypothetical protein DBX59_11410 [Bacillota bacterium]
MKYICRECEIEKPYYAERTALGNAIRMAQAKIERLQNSICDKTQPADAVRQFEEELRLVKIELQHLTDNLTRLSESRSAL